MASYLGDSEEIIPHARRALDYLPQDELAWRIVAYVPLGDANFHLGDMEAAYRAQSAVLDICVAAGNLFIILYANLSLAITLRQSGRLGQAQEICQQQVQMAEESGMGHTAVAGWISSIWGEVLAELNDLDGAIHQARKGVALTEQGGDVMMLGWSYLCLMRVLFSRGDLSAAEETIQRIRNDGRESGLPPWAQSQLAAWQARVWLAQGRFEAASQWVAERGLAADGELAHPRETEYITLARILIAQGLPGKATKLLDRLLEAAEGGGRTSRAIEILNLQSLAWEAQSDANGAVSQLERSLALAKPGGFVRTYVDEGPPMARLLHEAAARGIAPDYAGSLLATFEGAAKGQRTEKEVPSSVLSASSRQAFHSSSSLVEPLSERELEVLHLIAEGLTNREIAARLFVSLNTVKAHTRNVYGKLGVNNRMQAATKARALGILPPT
jgi:LuxR family maltose regulon positive regulatory protein